MGRNAAVDISKGIAIILVLIGHLPIPFWLVNLIYFFHMPFFICISGYFHKNNAGFKNTMRKGGRIVVSYFFYGLIFFLLSYMLFHNVETKQMWGLLLFRPLDIWNIPFFGVFWFVVALFIIKVLASLIKINHVSILVYVLLFFLVRELYERYEFINNLPFAVSQALMLIVFYSLGTYLPKIPAQQSGRYFLISVALFIVLAFFSFFLYHGNESKIVNYHNIKLFNPFLALLLAAAGSLSLYSFSLMISKSKNLLTDIVTKLGEFSFTFYALHLFVFFVVRRGITAFGLNSWISIILVLLISIIIIAFGIFTVNKVFKGHKMIQQTILLK